MAAIFFAVGAHLARGDDWTQVGPVVEHLVRLDMKSASLDDRGLSGEVIALDGPFGNLVTNISAEDFQKLGYRHGDRVKATIAGHEIAMAFVRTFSECRSNSRCSTSTLVGEPASRSIRETSRPPTASSHRKPSSFHAKAIE